MGVGGRWWRSGGDQSGRWSGGWAGDGRRGESGVGGVGVVVVVVSGRQEEAVTS